MYKRLILVISLLGILAACGPGPKAITEGTLRNTIFSVEPRVNGTISVWMTNDDVGVYCTTDQSLGRKALDILKSHSAEVIMTYRSVNQGDPEWGAWIDLTGAYGCGDNNKGTTRYKILTIEPASDQ